MLESVSKIFEEKIDSKLKLYGELQLPDVQLYTLQTRFNLSVSRNASGIWERGHAGNICFQFSVQCICSAGYEDY
jgi:hypothetical protein